MQVVVLGDLSISSSAWSRFTFPSCSLTCLPNLCSCSPFSDILLELWLQEPDTTFQRRMASVWTKEIWFLPSHSTKPGESLWPQYCPHLAGSPSWPRLKLHYTANKVSAVWGVHIPYTQLWSLSTWVRILATLSLIPSQRWLPRLLWTVSSFEQTSLDFNTLLHSSGIKKKSFCVFLFSSAVLCHSVFLQHPVIVLSENCQPFRAVSPRLESPAQVFEIMWPELFFRWG